MRIVSFLMFLTACEGTKSSEDSDNDGYLPENGDCNDEDFFVNPSVADEFGDGVDSNCDGHDGTDSDLDGHASVSSGGEDCDDENELVNPDATEVCDDVDNDCDDLLNELDDSLDSSTAELLYLDNDRDEYGDPEVPFYSCSETTEGVSNNLDCDDSTADVSPAALELCDGLDNDCDHLIDDADPNVDVLDFNIYYVDTDGDGYGQNTISACTLPSGASEEGGDCDDGNDAINPLAVEICDEVDNDCDSLIDDDDDSLDLNSALVLYSDQDNDGFGDPSSMVESCELEPGYSENDLDCDDDEPNTYFGAAEMESPTLCMTDADGDGYGDMNVILPAIPGSDCNDQAFTIYPGASDMTVDGFDQDCNNFDGPDMDNDGHAPVSAGGDDCDDGDVFTYTGVAINEVDVLCMRDFDGDGYGDQFPSNINVSAGSDCNDADWDISPMAFDIPDDQIDQDCDGADSSSIQMVSDFSLPDVNPFSATLGQYYSPRDYLQQVSGWYFIHAT